VSWEWLKGHESLILGFGILSFIAFVTTLILIPVLIIRMDRDYFVRQRESSFARGNPLLRGFFWFWKNSLGLFLLFIGIVMLFIPGQGLLTILLGLSFLDFPGKKRLQLRLLRISAVNCSLNWIRRKNGKEPLIIP
jgi:hypothetical protein